MLPLELINTNPEWNIDQGVNSFRIKVFLTAIVLWSLKLIGQWHNFGTSLKSFTKDILQFSLLHEA